MPEALFQLAFIGPGGPEFIVVMLVLLMMFGAKDAPRIFRKINEMMNSIRKTADGFKREIMYGDLNSDPSPTGTSHDGDDDYDHDDGYGYDEDDATGDYLDEELERDYSDETFQNLENDLAAEQGGETDDVPATVEPADEVEDGDAQKT
jgi:Sec-independent protein translocase protein TatA